MLTTLHFLSEPSAQDVRSSNRPFGTDQEPSAQDARSSNHLTLIKEPSVQDVRSTTLLYIQQAINSFINIPAQFIYFLNNHSIIHFKQTIATLHHQHLV